MCSGRRLKFLLNFPLHLRRLGFKCFQTVQFFNECINFKIINSETTLYRAATISVLYLYGVICTDTVLYCTDTVLYCTVPVLHLELKQILRYKIPQQNIQKPLRTTDPRTVYKYCTVLYHTVLYVLYSLYSVQVQ